nr:RNA-directed DNA polymerase, eukaryota [Tanacetum cinerariifolium]
MEDRWFFDLNGDGRFCVKDVRCLLDDVFLPKAEVPTWWIKSIPIKINIFAWKLCLDRLPTRVNLAKRNVAVASLLCPLCDSGMEDAAHLFFRCDMSKDVMFLVSHWWDLEDRRFGSFQEWLAIPHVATHKTFDMPSESLAVDRIGWFSVPKKGAKKGSKKNLMLISEGGRVIRLLLRAIVLPLTVA